MLTRGRLAAPADSDQRPAQHERMLSRGLTISAHHAAPVPTTWSDAVNRDGKTVALLQPPLVRSLVELLHSLPVLERTTLLAQAIRKGTMTRVGADQVLFALAWSATAAQRRRHLGEM